jgi:hypothetical protein
MFAVFTSPLVMAFNGGRSPSSGFPNSQRASATATFDSQWTQLELDYNSHLQLSVNPLISSNSNLSLLYRSSIQHLISSCLIQQLNSSEAEVKLRPTVNPSVCLGVGFSTGTHNQIVFFFCLTIAGFLMSGSPSSSLTRRWICNLLLQLILGLARAVTLRSNSCRTHGHILLSHLRLA